MGTATATLLVLALLVWLWLAVRGDRGRFAGVALAVAVGVGVMITVAGLRGFPLFAGTEGWVPSTTLAGTLRCAGASFTRLAGLEHHLAVPHARHLAPLALAVIALAALGARQLSGRRQWLFAGGVVLPFAAAALLAGALGHVAPLQAHRLLPVLPFLAALVGAGVAGAPGWRRWAATVLVLGVVGCFLALALWEA
jgi:hypothetical protein